MTAQKSRFPFVISVFIISIIFLISCNSEESNIQFNESDLNFIKSFPSEQSEALLKTPVNLTFSDEEIFISDQPQSTIFVFDHEGNYQRKIGREGAGPRDFNWQLMSRYYDGELFVVDQGNRRFSIFNVRTDSVLVEPMREIFRALAVSTDKIFGYYKPLETENIDSLSLIKVYDHELNRINSFGNFLNYTGNMPAGASEPHLEVHEDRLYVSSTTFPMVIVYDFEGNPIDTLKLETPDSHYQEIVGPNYEAETYGENHEGPYSLFREFSVNKQGLFFVVSNYEHALFIDHFDHDGNFIKRYREPISAEEFYLRDMKVVAKDNGTLRFYVLSISKVDMYEPATDNQETASLR